MGDVQYASLPGPVARRGFAAMVHNNRHRSRNAYERSWAFDEDTGEVREASRAQHVATAVAKELTRRYYDQGHPPRYFR